jgi:hypothetical protein
MTKDEFSLLFHRAQVNLVAFKQLYQPEAFEAMQRMVEMAVAEERQRTWVGLTKQDVYNLYNKMLAQEGNNIATRYQDFAKYLEAKLKEKNT